MANFINNKYARWYFELMQRASAREMSGYLERHHILPKCLGGTDVKENLVALSPREHFIAHLLLTKMVNDAQDKHKVCFAFNMMLKNKYGNRYKPTSRFYERARLMVKEAMTGRTVSPATRQKIGDAHRGKNVTIQSRLKMSKAKIGKSVLITKEHASKISASLMGKTKTAAHKEALSKAKVGKKGLPRTEEWKQKIAAAQKKRWEKCREKPAN